MIDKLLALLERLVIAHERHAAAQEAWIAFRKHEGAVYKVEAPDETPKEPVTTFRPGTEVVEEAEPDDEPVSDESDAPPLSNDLDPDDRAEIRRRLDEAEIDYNKKFGTKRLYQILMEVANTTTEDGVQEPDCKACNDTGVASNGRPCVPCQGIPEPAADGPTRNDVKSAVLAVIDAHDRKTGLAVLKEYAPDLKKLDESDFQAVIDACEEAL